MVAVALLHLKESRAEFEADARTSAENLSLLLQRDIRGSFDKIDLVLQDMVDTHALLGRDRIDPQEWTDILVHHRERISILNALRATSAEGIVLYGLDDKSVVGVSIADRDYFIRLRDNPGAGLVITRPVFGRTTKTWVIAFVRRLSRADGEFSGVVYAVLPLEHFTHTFDALGLGPSGSIGFRDSDLRLIARRHGWRLAPDYWPRSTGW